MKMRILPVLLLLSLIANLILLMMNPLPVGSRIMELEKTVDLLL